MRLGTLITTVVFLVALSVGIQVIEEVGQQVDESELNGEPQELCNGVFGGCSDQSPPFVNTVMYIGSMIVAISMISFLRGSPGEVETESKDSVTIVQEQYANGEIETVLELEQRLDDEMEDSDQWK